MFELRPAVKKTLRIVVQLLLIALVGWFVRDSLVKAWRQIGDCRWQFDIFWLIVSGVTYLLALLPAGLFWHHILKVLGQGAGFSETLRAYYLGHLGKYVPGKAMVIVLRTSLIRSHRVSTSLAVVSIFYETLTMMAVGSFLAACILIFRLPHERLLFWGSLVFLVVVTLPTLPPVFRVVFRVLRLAKMQPEAVEYVDRLGIRSLLAGWLAMLMTWSGMAVSLWAIFRGLGLNEFGLSDHFFDYLVAVCLSVVAGFLAMIPGGLGVRDMLLVDLLVRLFALPASPAAVAGALLRFIWLVAELLIFVILYPQKRKTAKLQSPPPE